MAFYKMHMCALYIEASTLRFFTLLIFIFFFFVLLLMLLLHSVWAFSAISPLYSHSHLGILLWNLFRVPFNSLMPFHVCDPVYVVIRNADEYAPKPYINNKRCRRCQPTDSECYCAKKKYTLPNKNVQWRSERERACDCVPGELKKSTQKPIKRCNVILPRFPLCLSLSFTITVFYAILPNLNAIHNAKLNKNRNNKQRKHAMDVYLPFHHFVSFQLR